MEVEVLGVLSQFGAAGLIGLLWIMERRHGAARDRQLTEAHRKLTENHRANDVLLDVVKENTRAIVTLEHTQRQLIAVVKKLFARRTSPLHSNQP